jgi:hypothetical protein
MTFTKIEVNKGKAQVPVKELESNPADSIKLYMSQ